MDDSPRILKHPAGERQAMSDEARALFRLGIDLANPTHTESVFSVQAELSICLELIAQELFRCAWILTGKQTTTDWTDLPLALQQRYRYLAERAIATIDPAIRLQFQAEAAKETDDWVNGPGRGKDDAVTYRDIANYAIGTYEAKLAGVRVDVERDL